MQGTSCRFRRREKPQTFWWWRSTATRASKPSKGKAGRRPKAGDVVNLGVGMGSQLPSVLAEEGALDDITFSVEHGALDPVVVKRGEAKVDVAQLEKLFLSLA